MPQVTAYACDDETTHFHPLTITVREPGPTEVLFDVKYAGICHSDIHTARSEWRQATYPLVPGHEIAGIVTKIGSQVTKFAVGDKIGVGCMVDSCRVCGYCKDGTEQFCDGPGGTLWTYGPDRNGAPTAGGYAKAFTVDQDFGLHIPEAIDFSAAAPLMCAGITTYSPLHHWGAGPGKKVAIVGLGGLGHVAVQIAAAMGAEVSVISRTLAKQDDGLRLGASHYYAMSEPGTASALRGSFDLILTTVSGSTDLDPIIGMLTVGGVLVDVGLPEHASTLHMSGLTHGARILAGSLIGGIAETQEMLDFCADHDIAPIVEVIGGEDITAAYDKVVASKVRYRYVIDTSTF
ncbi:NAD(P)-dependent alcohol dehydrogenase [Propionibacterium sp.]|uniref:NAD(P)-dependent alcohol dehydrogenase n=1 Tax=Propionibacterium sp. TaxID=1977903 RepID=UPI0039EC3774